MNTNKALRTQVVGFEPMHKLKSIVRPITAFIDDQDGAITVDFVVLTAAIALLGLTVVSTFSGAAIQVALDTAENMQRPQE